MPTQYWARPSPTARQTAPLNVDVDFTGGTELDMAPWRCARSGKRLHFSKIRRQTFVQAAIVLQGLEFHSPGDVRSVSHHERANEFLLLFNDHAWQLRGFVRALVPAHADADDVFQELSRTLWTEFEHFQTGTDFLAWARCVAKFKILQHRRAKGRLPTNLSDNVFDLLSQEMMDGRDQRHVYMQYLTECLNSLPQCDREMIEVRYRSGQPPKQVADTVNRSVDSVYRSLRRIHKVLLMCIHRRQAEERSS